MGYLGIEVKHEGGLQTANHPLNN